MIEKAIQRFKSINKPVLFFFDKDQEYSEAVKNWNGDEFKILEVNDNYFWIKYMVESELKDKKVLLYHPFAQPQGSGLKEYPLLDLLLAGELLLIDEIAELMDKHFIPYHYVGLLKKYQRFVKAAKYQKELVPFLSGPSFDEDKFRNAIISILLNEKRTGNSTFNLISVFEIMNEGEEVWEKHHRDIEKLELEETLKQAILNVSYISVEDISYASLKRLFLTLKYNAITRNINDVAKEDPYAKLKQRENLSVQNNKLFFSEWSENKLRNKNLEKVLNGLGAEIDANKLIEVYGVETEYGLISAGLTAYLVRESLAHLPDSPDWVIEQLAPRKGNPEEMKGYEAKVDFLLNSAYYFAILKNFLDFDFNYIDDYINRYIGEIYKLDLHYRHAYIAYRQIERESGAEEFEEMFALLNKSYDSYLRDLNIAWLKILQEKEFDLNSISTQKQYSFYRNFIEKDSNKKVVIISDAFRYELAVELMQQLTDTQNRLELTPMLASIPSVTSLGMSNLLPNKGITADTTSEKLEWNIEGEKTVSTNREKILQTAEAESITLSYAEFVKLGTEKQGAEKQRAVLKDKRVVYIYHNWMDTIGDSKTSEHYTFESVKTCISQLYDLIYRLYNSLNTYNILLTADHGFLFNYETISEASKQPLPTFEQSFKEHSRYCITSDSKKPNDTLMFPLKNTSNIDTELNVVIPKGINRFRKQGSGVQFVHGGASLQELIVPVLSVYRVRRAKAEEVGFMRIDSTKNISAGAARFRFLQETPIDEGIKALSVSIALYDIDNRLISNELKIEFNSTDKQATGRTFEVILELNSEGSKSAAGYLKVYKSSDEDKLNELYKSDMIKISTLTVIDEF